MSSALGVQMLPEITQEHLLSPILPPDIMREHILPNVVRRCGRNLFSLVCKEWLRYERSTRSKLRAKCTARRLRGIISCWPNIKELNLVSCSYIGTSLGSCDSDIQEALAAAFPFVTRLEFTGFDYATAKLVGKVWPHLKEIEVHGTVYQASSWVHLFSHCRELEVVGFTPADDDIYGLPPPESGVSLDIPWPPNLRACEGVCIVDCDEVIADLAQKCSKLEILSCHLLKNTQGAFTEASVLSIAKNCSKLKTLRLPIDTELPFNDHALLDLAHGCPELTDWAIWGTCRISGRQVAAVAEKAPNLCCVEVEELDMPCYGPGQGLAACRRLKDLKIWSCPELTNEGLGYIAQGCPRLELVELYKCENITPLGLETLCTLVCKTLENILYDMSGLPFNLGVFHVAAALAPGPGKANLQEIQLIYNEPRAAVMSIGDALGLPPMCQWPMLKTISVWTGGSAGVAQVRFLLDIWLRKCPALETIVLSTELSEEASMQLLGAVASSSTVSTLDVAIDPTAFFHYLLNGAFQLNCLEDLKLGVKFANLGSDGLLRLCTCLSRLPKLKRLRFRSCDDREVKLLEQALQILLESSSLREAQFYSFQLEEVVMEEFYGELLKRE